MEKKIHQRLLGFFDHDDGIDKEGDITLLFMDLSIGQPNTNNNHQLDKCPNSYTPNYLTYTIRFGI